MNRAWQVLQIEALETRQVLSLTFAEIDAFGDDDVRGVEFGDLDGDLDADAFVFHLGRPNEIWLNDGHGRFSDTGQRMEDVWTNAAALGDVDGDGDLDAIVGNTRYFIERGRVTELESNKAEPNSLWYNDGNGIFVQSPQSLGKNNSVRTELADIDNDGDLDAIIAAYLESN